MFIVSYDYVTTAFTTIVCENPFNHKSMIEMTSKNCLQALIHPKMN